VYDYRQSRAVAISEVTCLSDAGDGRACSVRVVNLRHQIRSNVLQSHITIRIQSFNNGLICDNLDEMVPELSQTLT